VICALLALPEYDKVNASVELADNDSSVASATASVNDTNHPVAILNFSVLLVSDLTSDSNVVSL
jgi:hypothetical protein